MMEPGPRRWRLWHLCLTVAIAGILCVFLRTDVGPMALVVMLAALVATVLTRPVVLDFRDDRAGLAENGGGSRIGRVVGHGVAACGLGLIWLMIFSVVLTVLLGVVIFFRSYSIQG